MNVFKAIGLFNKIEKAVKNSKKIIDAKKGTADQVKKIINNICGEIQDLIRLLPDFRNIYFEILEIIENIK